MRSPSLIYLLTRVHGLSTHLLNSDDYSALVKAPDIRYILDYLLHTDYGDYLSAIPIEQLNIKNMLSSIAQKYSDRVFYLIQFTGGGARTFLREYARKIEVENIKRIIRAKFGNKPISTDDIIPIPRGYEEINFSAMTEAPSTDTAIEYVTVSIYNEAPQYLVTAKELGSLMPLEAYIENKYFESVLKAARNVTDARDVRDAVIAEADLKNLYYILGLKYMDIPVEILSSILSTIKIGYVYNWTEEFSRVKFEMVLDRIWNSRYNWIRDYIQEAVAKGDLSLVGRGIQKAIHDYFRSIMARKPLSFVYVVSYLSLVEAEYKNLETIITSVSIGLSPEEINKLIL